jgi:Arc/MetJ family transcription regulator
MIQTRDSIERLRLYFASSPTRQGLLARRALEQPAPDDELLAQRLIDELKRGIPRDGGGAGPVVPAIWRAHELLDLGCGDHDPECVRLTRQLLSLQELPGAFSQGCSRTRHAHRVCEHFISGFFSPAPPEQRLAPVMLPNGKVFRAEPAARFAVSCLALRVAVRSPTDNRPALEQHRRSLLQLSEQWTDWNGYFAGDAIVAGIHALACVSGIDRTCLSRLASLIAGEQSADGSWPHSDFFATLEALRALGTPEAHAAVRRAVPTLVTRQRIDGSFGTTAQQERALIALRALIWAEQDG